MSDINVREMTIDDLPEVIVIENQSFQTPWKKRDFLYDLIKNKFSHYLIIEIDDQIIGYCGIWIVLEAAQITNIAVSPDERGNRYGEKLFQEVLQYTKAKGATELSLEVRQSNIVAQRLYEKFGLKAVGTRESYYQDDGEDALVMWVKL
ncbi:ribosomal protein S18-alanine N-acetyltransferase [Tenuibacillus multivorans]|uniref:[Ribosomal protein bS18]-alanine N-acetyltransferase n=1 Tax=Tenuibacillus multivorans TaxID=237069 RepID=A0A1H0E4V8_9BACI|nr:ribosomal protein S18-alanine N-acetyltransferase [Tenuibacillus multivorans]GEL76654.1 putative ribosomal-protein-alanine acetyltransferase [Tenuibacillus multivorans]SDN77338.1 ribosomal-protein-alanine N-acetyltransferase [Tenuibacillus multivorans]